MMPSPLQGATSWASKARSSHQYHTRSRALDIALPRFTRRLETMHYIKEYEHEEAHNCLILELARLNFNLVRALHLRELKDLSV